MRATATSRPVLGWREWVGLPELGVKWIKAKVDTGARSSALHAWDVEYFRRRGVEMVRFKLHPLQRETTTTVAAEAELIDRRPVTNSGGRSELRPVVRALLRCRDDEWPIELTLTRRDVMGFRMLIGREAIRGRYLVDPGRSFLGGRPLRKKRRGTVKKKGKRKVRPSRNTPDGSDLRALGE